MGKSNVSFRPLKKAVALRYRPRKDRAPKVTAKGEGWLAEKIIALARENGIPIREDPALIQILSQLDLHQEIPPETYLLIAEILAYVYRMNQKWKASRSESEVGKKFPVREHSLPLQEEEGMAG